MNSLKLLLKTSLVAVTLLVGGNAFSFTCYDSVYGYYECAEDDYYKQTNPYYYPRTNPYYYPRTNPYYYPTVFFFNVGPTDFRHFRHFHGESHHFHGGFHQFHGGGGGFHFHGGGFHGGHHHHHH